MPEQNQYSLEDLLYLMRRLRDPQDGCPWDLKQSYRSILPHTLEEVYEVADAIERHDLPHLREELGDLLFQVVFYARIAEEEGEFDFTDIIHDLVSKLVRRHPHVFPEGTLESRRSASEVVDDDLIRQQWEQIKQQEKQAAERQVQSTPQFKSVLDDVPQAFPALMRAHKLQSKAARQGFDWPEIGPVFDKIQEEIGELQEVLEGRSAAAGCDDVQSKLEDEFGDILFCCVNLARFLKVDPEQALRRTNNKFTRRFRYIEKVLNKKGQDMVSLPLEYLDALWEEAKVQD